MTDAPPPSPKPIRGPFHSVAELRTYALLWKAAKDLKPSTNDWPVSTCVALGVLCAFTLEAYMNHLGGALETKWAKEAERLRPNEKLTRISKLLSHPTDRKSRPFRTFGDMFKFRNEVAHGKNEFWFKVGDPSVMLDRAFKEPRPKACWERQCTHKIVSSWVEDVDAMIRQLHAAQRPTPHGLEADPFKITYSQSFGTGAPPPGSSVGRKPKNMGAPKR